MAGNLPSKPVWLEQVHGKDVLKLTGEPYASKRADASYSNSPGTVCAVMTADCLPVLFAIARVQKWQRLTRDGVGFVRVYWKRP
jgi:copper oxidase (laccase) domain-containing protein